MGPGDGSRGRLRRTLLGFRADDDGDDDGDHDCDFGVLMLPPRSGVLMF